MQKLWIAALVAASSSLAANAAPTPTLVLETGVSSKLIDRGESLADLNAEAAMTAEFDLGAGALYGSIYRITPLGDNDEAFAEEVDYTIGYAFEVGATSFDASANYLTYPGNNGDASLELAAFAEFDIALQPALIGFYDADFEDYGLELSAGPAWEIGDWSLRALGRIGFVSPGGGSGDYTYGGAELNAERALNEALSLGVFARVEAADEPTFADNFMQGEATNFRTDGAGLGITLSWTLAGS